MKFSSKLILVSIITFTIFFLPSTILARPSIKNIAIKNGDHLIYIDANLRDAFNQRLIEAIKSGVPMTFTYEVELVREVPFFLDNTVSKNKITHSIQYDTLKKVYQFTSEGKNVHRKIITKSLERCEKLMLTLSHIPVAPLYKVNPEKKYYIRVKAELDANGFWFPFNYLLFFVPFNEFETSWAESRLLDVPQNSEFPQEAFNGNKTRTESSSEKIGNVIQSFSQ